MRTGAISYLYDMISNRVFLAAFISWLVAQLVKAVIDAVRDRRRTPLEFATTFGWRTGGMPSSHASTVTALTTTLGYRVGVRSPVFVLSLVYGLLVIRDAVGVRRAAGLQARALNRLGRQLADRDGVEYESVKEVHGHSPAEVLVGALLGFIIGTAFSVL